MASIGLHYARHGFRLDGDRLLPDTRHASSEPAMAPALVEATDVFAARPQLWLNRT